VAKAWPMWRYVQSFQIPSPYQAKTGALALTALKDFLSVNFTQRMPFPSTPLSEVTWYVSMKGPQEATGEVVVWAKIVAGKMRASKTESAK